jgi:hypothetical protein
MYGCYGFLQPQEVITARDKNSLKQLIAVNDRAVTTAPQHRHP